MHPLIKRLLIHMNLYPPLAMTYMEQPPFRSRNNYQELKQENEEEEDGRYYYPSWSRSLGTPHHMSMPAA